MGSDVEYIQVVRLDSGKYVWESRDAAGNVIATSKQFRKEAEAHQAGADAHPHQYGEGMTTARNPVTGEMQTSPEVLRLGAPVRHAIVNNGEPE